MTIPPNVVHAQFNGTLGDGEVFSVGFWLEGDAPTTLPAAQTYADVLASYFDQHLDSTLCSFLATGQSYDEVLIYSYPDGGTSALVSAVAELTTGAGTGIGNTLPLQCAVVVTTQSGFIGRRHRGRIYVPTTNAALTGNQLTTAQITSIVDAWQAFFNNCRISTVVGVPVVVSQVDVGSTVEVTALRADTRIDIQRRRAQDQVPVDTYSVGVS